MSFHTNTPTVRQMCLLCLLAIVEIALGWVFDPTRCLQPTCWTYLFILGQIISLQMCHCVHHVRIMPIVFFSVAAFFVNIILVNTVLLTI